MEEIIKKIYEEIFYIGFYSTYYRDNGYVDEAQKLLPLITEFVEWFMQENIFGIESELYNDLVQNLLQILIDCKEAFKQRDRVLLMDSLEQGLVEYLKLFLSETYLEEVKSINVRTEE